LLPSRRPWMYGVREHRVARSLRHRSERTRLARAHLIDVLLERASGRSDRRAADARDRRQRASQRLSHLRRRPLEQSMSEALHRRDLLDAGTAKLASELGDAREDLADRAPLSLLIEPRQTIARSAQDLHRDREEDAPRGLLTAAP